MEAVQRDTAHGIVRTCREIRISVVYMKFSIGQNPRAQTAASL